MRRRLAAAFILATAASCGSDGPTLVPDAGPPAGPQPLVADPAVVTTCLADPPAAGQVRAKPVACAAELPPGRLAAGRVGDLVLANARLTVIVRGFGPGYYMPGTAAGGIVDAARAGGDDLVKEIQPLAQLNAGGFDEIVITEAGDDGPATITVRGRATVVPLLAAAIASPVLPAVFEHQYVLAADADEVLLRTILWGDPGADGTAQVGDVLFLGGRAPPFAPGRGFLEGGTTVELVASAGTSTSYGLAYAPDAVTALQFLNIGGVTLALGPAENLAGGNPVERWLIVGDGSVASVTERAWALRGAATGTVHGSTAPGVDVVVRDDGDRLITVARADGDGAYRVVLPAGAYVLAPESPGRLAGQPAAVTVEAVGEHALDLPAGTGGRLHLTVRDADGGLLPARVMLGDATGERIEYAGADGTLELPLPTGDYDLTVSRGLEYDAFTMTPLTIAADTTAEVEATLTRVIDTTGWISLDTHLHSEMSTDSTMPLEDRLAAVAAEGVEIAISTDHDFVTDYAPLLDELGLSDWVASRVGEETSSLIWGHINVWPLVADHDQVAGGAVPWYGRSPGEVFALMRAAGGGIIQVNHPRLSGSGLFAIIDFDPQTVSARRDPAELGLPGADLDDFDFDAIEVGNDFTGDDFELAFLDWLALVGDGHPAAATGSSDSHGRSAFSGNSRTYVWVGAGQDDPATVDLDAVDQALRARHAVVAQGAFVTAGLVDPGSGLASLPGDLVDLAGAASAMVHIVVQAPPWMPLQRIRVLAGAAGTAVLNVALDPADTAALRYDGAVEVALDGTDVFFVVIVDPAGRGDPVLGQPDASFTNPLLVDGDGDGVWTP